MYMVLDITKLPNGTITFIARPEIYAFYTIWKSQKNNNWETPPAVLLDIIWLKEWTVFLKNDIEKSKNIFGIES